MIIVTAERTDESGKITETKFRLNNPEFEQWLKDSGETLNGIEFEDE